jgi:TATA-binding protein-associated factor
MQQQYGQDVIDSLSVLDAVVPTLHEALWARIVMILPMITLALRSRYAIIRQCAAKCMATICSVMTTDAMHFVIENIVPFLGDALNLPNRQGATELVYRTRICSQCVFLALLIVILPDIVRRLDVKALPYVIFMVVPVLGRMSDPDDNVRSVATNTFASLVKMVPLEVRMFQHFTEFFNTNFIITGWPT